MNSRELPQPARAVLLARRRGWPQQRRWQGIGWCQLQRQALELLHLPPQVPIAVGQPVAHNRFAETATQDVGPHGARIDPQAFGIHFHGAQIQIQNAPQRLVVDKDADQLALRQQQVVYGGNRVAGGRGRDDTQSFVDLPDILIDADLLRGGLNREPLDFKRQLSLANGSEGRPHAARWHP